MGGQGDQPFRPKADGEAGVTTVKAPPRSMSDAHVAILVVLTLALAPVAEGDFRAWPASPPAPVAQPSRATVAEARGLILGTEPRPPCRLEPYGAGYVILPGDVVIVGSGSAWGAALGTGK